MRLRRAASTALLLGAIPVLAAGQTTLKTYFAFGDSITKGIGDDRPEDQAGYPPRLQSLLQAAGVSATVVNSGMSGEKTPDGLTRLNNIVLPQTKAGDILILMEGTNDINKAVDIETTIFDLDTMADRARKMGLDVIHAT
ncbi:MAG TPA: GDSL-type esterase/lipase family protein, partial [Thermoanaerobaculia bacterium]